MAVAIAALILHISFDVFTPANVEADAVGYDQTAYSLVNGNGFKFGEDTPAVRWGPGYPIILAGTYLIFGHRYLPVFLLQTAFVILTSWIIFNFAKKRFTPLTAFLAGSALLFYIPGWIFEHSILTEVTYLLGVTLLCILLENAHGKSYRYFALTGILTGFLILVRSTLMLWPLVFALFGIFYYPKETGYIPKLALYVIVSVIVVLPWTIRNYVVFEKFVPVSAGLGLVLWPGNNPELNGDWPYERSPQGSKEMMNAVAAPGVDEVDKDRLLVSDAIEMMKENPFSTLKLWLIKSKRFWIEDFWNPRYISEYYNLYKERPLLIKTCQFFEILMFCFFLIGIILSFRKIPVIVLMMLYFTAIHVATLAISRYRFPLIAFELMIAFYGLAKAIQYLKRKPIRDFAL